VGVELVMDVAFYDARLAPSGVTQQYNFVALLDLGLAGS